MSKDNLHKAFPRPSPSFARPMEAFHCVQVPVASYNSCLMCTLCHRAGWEMGWTIPNSHIPSIPVPFLISIPVPFLISVPLPSSQIHFPSSHLPKEKRGKRLPNPPIVRHSSFLHGIRQHLGCWLQSPICSLHVLHQWLSAWAVMDYEWHWPHHKITSESRTEVKVLFM